jgi:hypothetical protein
MAEWTDAAMTRALAIAADAPQPETSRRRGRIGNRALGLAMRLPDRCPVVRRSFLRTAASSPMHHSPEYALGFSYSREAIVRAQRRSAIAFVAERSRR